MSPTTVSGIPALSRFGVPLGLAGLGGAWSAATSSLGSPMWPEEILYGAASFLWLILTALYVFRGLRRKGAFRADLRHELAGPFASFIPWWGSCRRRTTASICRHGMPGCAWLSLGRRPRPAHHRLVTRSRVPK
ncbi:hypothetical protein J7E80_19795 [Arthrobacter sp. ISL-28]|nr:hypothetical protein [Arthrobacter sp. ISL-28]